MLALRVLRRMVSALPVMFMVAGAVPLFLVVVLVAVVSWPFKRLYAGKKEKENGSN